MSTITVPDEQVALIALMKSRPNGLTVAAAKQKLLEHGDPIAAWNDANEHLLATQSPELDDARALALDWSNRGLRLVSILDPEYPVRLRGIHQAPAVLFARGLLVPHDDGVSIVGSRAADASAVDVAAACARTLVSMGLTVISGLAAGIDAAAHRAALDAGGRTVAFIGNGIAAPGYPKENRDLQEAVADRGLVLSQFWPDDKPHRGSFLMRNASMSGYGVATVVVTASETSGTRAQARMAVEHGRPVLLTDRVVASTQWGKDLQGRPGVHVISGTADLVRVIEEIRAAEVAWSSWDRLFSAT